MITTIRMIEDRDGAYDHINIVTYRAGEIYSREGSDLPISQDLLDGFVASGHAIEVDAQGNPVNRPGRRQTKPTTAQIATKDDDDTPGEYAPSAREAIMSRFQPGDDPDDAATPQAESTTETLGDAAPVAELTDPAQ